MAHGEMVDSYVRELLNDRYGDDVALDNGHYVTPTAAAVGVTVRGTGSGLRVTAATVVAEGLIPSLALLERLNEISAGLLYGRLYLEGDAVVAEHSVLGATVDGDSLMNAIGHTDWLARTVAPELVDGFGASAGVVPQPQLPGFGLDPSPEPSVAAARRGPARGSLLAIGAAGYL